MKTKLIIILSFVVINITAQTNEEEKTLFGNGKPHIGYFINPSCQFGKFAGANAVIPGIGAGVILNKKYSLNILYKLTVTESTPAGEANQLYLHGQWFGFKAEYSLKPEGMVHLNFPLEIGAGEIELDLKDSYENDQVIIPSGDAWFAYLEPAVAVEINLQKYIKLNLSAGYRFVSEVTYRNISEKDLKGFTFTAGLKIGLF
jgi:hypothetical protein